MHLWSLPGNVLTRLFVILIILLVVVTPVFAETQIIPNTETIPSVIVSSVFVSGLTTPVGIYPPGDGSERLFIVEQGGMIKLVKNGVLQPTPFLALNPDSQVLTGGERGLLGLAFHPNYENNGLFFINYTRRPDGATVISRYKVSGNPDLADPTSKADILVIGQPYANHNGGHIAFGPDGYLYIGMGDGGSGGDPQNYAQNMNGLLGKMLRIDPNTSIPAGYSVPVGNLQGEIWALGLRNPWFWSFDRANGDIYIGDVGQNAWEEIDYRSFTDPPGANFGWRCLEGNNVYDLSLYPCNDPNFVAGTVRPIAEYSHNEGFSVTGGYVYRGSLYPNMVGRYFYADFVTGLLWSMVQTSTQPVTFSAPVLHLDADFAVSCFGEDASGELYVCNYYDGKIHRVQDASGAQPNLTGSWFKSNVPYADNNQEVTYTLHLVNSGGPSPNPVSLQIAVPDGLTYKPGSLIPPEADDVIPTLLTWQGILTPNIPVDIQYTVTVDILQGNPITQAAVSGVGYTPLSLKHALLIPTSLLASTSIDFFTPGTQPNTLVNPVLLPASCDVCHTALIMDPWQGSMMSQAGRDPLFWAALEVANRDAPDSGEYCLRCHTPKGWLEGRSSAADGSALKPTDIDAGVTCEICHRAVSPINYPNDQSTSRDAGIRSSIIPPLPVDHNGSAMLILDPLDFRRGPFNLGVNFAYHPNQTFRTDYLGGTPNNYIARSSLCGTCHNVDNPLFTCTDLTDPTVPCELNSNGNLAPSFNKDALFSIETTYEEWLFSSYRNSAACQDCHMPGVKGYAAEPFFNSAFRDCGVQGCLPLHDLVGGNTWVPQLLQDTRWRLNRADLSGLFNQTILKARSMLLRAATVSVNYSSGGLPKATIRVTNLAGHKLPTGYPEGRRMWLDVRAYNQAGVEIFSSCDYDPVSGILTENQDCKVFEIKQGISQNLANMVNKNAGSSFHFILNNVVVKDNRIPPAGFSAEALSRRSLAPVTDPIDFVYLPDQNYAEFDIDIPPSAVQVTAFLYYQTASKEYIEFLASNGSLDAQTLRELWVDFKSPPELMAWGADPIRVVFFPLIFR